MKTTKFTLLCAIFMTVLTSVTAQAQLKDMTWETNNLKFKVPENITISQNDGDVFSASEGIFTFVIKGWEPENFDETPKDICNETFDKVQQSNATLIDEVEISYQGGLFGYEKYYTAYQNGRLMHMFIAGFQDDDLYGLMSYSVLILYWDNLEKNEANYNKAIAMLNSFELTY